MQKLHLHGVFRRRCVPSCGLLALEAAPRSQETFANGAASLAGRPAVGGFRAAWHS